MQWGDAGRSAMMIQAAVAAVALTACIAMTLISSEREGEPLSPWLLVVAAALLMLPLLWRSGDQPSRWIVLAGFRLYIASVLIPSALWLIASHTEARKVITAWAGAVAIAAVMAIHPDASQVTAFSAACLLILFRSQASNLTRVLVSLSLALCVVAAWMQPDPYAPVPYVEGVIQLAATRGTFTELAAIATLILPCAVIASIVWRARTGSQPGYIAVALYYVIICSLAARMQITPMPLLGFGAGPILGYFLFVATTARQSRRA
jgi:cell division protein FtsW (lipid II flippase)